MRVSPTTPSEGEHSKEVVKSFIQGSSSGYLSSFNPIIWFLFPHLTSPGTLPWVHTHPSAKMDLEAKASGRSKTPWPGTLSPPLTHGKPCGARAVSPVSQKSGGQRPLSPLLTHAPPSLCLCPRRDYYLKVFTKSKHWLFTLCGDFHFKGQTGG